MVRRPLIAFALMVLTGATGCAHERSLRLQAKDDFQKKDFAAAESKLISPDVAGESKSRLLTLVELGTVAHNKKEYEKSQLFFEKARELAQKLYTESVSEKAASAVLNDNSQTYAGLDFEKSMIHYYLVMNNLLLAQAGQSIAWEMPLIKEDKTTVFEQSKNPARTFTPKESADFLNRARSEVLAWDSYLDSIRGQNRGMAVYKDDIGAKLLAAYVHRMAGTNEDKNIAQVLYKNANDLIIKSYGLYPSFNKQSAKFADEFSSLANKDESELMGRVVDPTESYEKLGKFVKFSSEAAKSGSGNALIVLESGMLPEKRERNFKIGLGALIDKIENPELRQSVASIGVQVLFQFMPLVVLAGAVEEGIDEENDRRNPMGSIDNAIGFRFELPYIDKVLSDVNYAIVLTNITDATKIEVPMVTVDPLSDFAWHEVNQKSNAVAAKTGVRVGLKYLAALVPAYLTYKNVMNKTKSEFLALTAASTVWMIGKKVVDATEAADVRAWNMLPQTISMMEARIPPGKYTALAMASRGSESWTEDLGEVEINSHHQNVVKLRVMHVPSTKAGGKAAAGLP